MRRMYSDKRRSGIPSIGNLPWGTHFCQFYETQEDLLDILVPYFRAGLASNECCVYVACDPLGQEDARRVLQKKLRNYDEHTNKGQVVIVASDRWHSMGAKSGKAIVSMLDRAISSGFDGLRIACHALPAGRDGRDFVCHGADIIGAYNVIGLFTYPRHRFDATGLMEVVKRHRYALVRNEARWEAIESSEARIIKEALNRSEQKLQSLFHNMSEGFAYHRIVLDAGGKPCDYVFLETNKAFEQLTGLKAKDILGKKVTEVLPGMDADPTDWIGKYGQVALTGRPIQFENYAAPLERWYTVSAFSSHKGFFAVTFSDITGRKQADEQLQKAHDELEQKVLERTEELQKTNRMLRLISECNQVLVRATDEVELTRAICRLVVELGGYRMAWVGYTDSDEGKTVRPVASHGFEDGYLTSIHISLADEAEQSPTGRCIRTCEARIEGNLPENPDQYPWLVEALKRGYQSCVALPLMSGGRALGSLTIFSENPGAFDAGQAMLLRELADDTAFGIVALRVQKERDHARKTAEKRAEQLQALAAELVEAEQRERRRLAQILHDHLQQLLVGAKFGASLIQAKAEDKEIGETAGQLCSTLDEAIRASRSLSADLSPPVLHEKGLIAGLEWLGRQMEQKHGLAVEVDADTAAEPAAEQIRLFLFEAARELLLNIVKYARAERAQVQMRALESGEIELVVADEGTGFDPARLEGGTSTTGGFGLFSIRERLGHFGGRMTIDSAPGKGSRFTLVGPSRLGLPAATKHFTAESKSASAMDKTDAGGKGFLAPDRKIRILIADDHPVMRQGLARLLQEEPDIEVVGEAGDGQVAVDLVRQLRPDVVLMDVSLPLVNGFDATRRIMSEFPSVRVIGLSMHEETDMASAMRKAGAVEYLTKGGPIERLMAAIRA